LWFAKAAIVPGSPRCTAGDPGRYSCSVRLGPQAPAGYPRDFVVVRFLDEVWPQQLYDADNADLPVGDNVQLPTTAVPISDRKTSVLQ
jgi:hypothetical protein